MLCEGKYHPPVLYKTRHGSYRRMFSEVSTGAVVPLSPGQAVVLLPLPPVQARVTQAARHTLCAAHLWPTRGTKCPQYSTVLHFSKVSYPTRKLLFPFCFQLSQLVACWKKKVWPVCALHPPLSIHEQSLWSYTVCLFPPTMLLLPNIIFVAGWRVIFSYLTDHQGLQAEKHCAKGYTKGAERWACFRSQFEFSGHRH